MLKTILKTEAAGLQIKRGLDIDVEEDEVKLYPLVKLLHRQLQQEDAKKIHLLIPSLCLDTLGGGPLQIICSGEGAATQVASHRVRVTLHMVALGPCRAKSLFADVACQTILHNR
jgi:hypothetical protein